MNGLAVQKTTKGNKKIWFKRITHNLAIPISIEGWVSMSIIVYWAFSLLSRASDKPLDLTRDWPQFLELAAIVLVSLMLFRGRAE